MKNAPDNSTCLSHRTQNAFVDLCVKQISNTLITQIKESTYFTILVDETADVIKTEQIATCLRYLTAGNFKLQEDFISFVGTTDTTGETPTKLSIFSLQQMGLELHNMVGQGFDGAANMSGNTRGVQARIKQYAPGTTYVHCRSHKLNLAVGNSCTVLPIRNMYDIASMSYIFLIGSKLLSFISSSPRRIQIYLDQVPEDIDPKTFEAFLPNKMDVTLQQCDIHCPKLSYRH